MPTCELCSREVPENRFVSDFGICDVCAVRLNSKVKAFQAVLPGLQEKANAAQNPEEKILYLHSILDLLYEYKILYADNNINAIEQDVDELIDQVIDCISCSRI